MEIKKKKKKKITEQQITEKLRKQCVSIAKRISKIKDNYKCIYCGIGKPQRLIHSHHFFHEGLYKSMSADVDNLVSLCASHHQGGLYMKSHDKFNFHNSPREGTEWFMENYPKRYKELKERSMLFQDLTYKYWEDKLVELKKQLEKYVKKID